MRDRALLRGDARLRGGLKRANKGLVNCCMKIRKCHYDEFDITLLATVKINSIGLYMMG